MQSLPSFAYARCFRAGGMVMKRFGHESHASQTNCSSGLDLQTLDLVFFFLTDLTRSPHAYHLISIALLE